MAAEEAVGLRVRQRLVSVELAPARARQMDDAAARIVLLRRGLDQSFVLEAAQQPAHQPGIEPEIVANLGHVRTSMPDRVEHARCSQRPPAPEERIVERAHGSGDGTVEAADAGDGVEHDA